MVGNRQEGGTEREESGIGPPPPAAPVVEEDIRVKDLQEEDWEGEEVGIGEGEGECGQG